MDYLRDDRVDDVAGDDEALQLVVARAEEELELLEGERAHLQTSQGCQMAKFDPFLSLDCARVEGVGAQSKEWKGSNFAA